MLHRQLPPAAGEGVSREPATRGDPNPSVRALRAAALRTLSGTWDFSGIRNCWIGEMTGTWPTVHRDTPGTESGGVGGVTSHRLGSRVIGHRFTG